MIQHEEQEQITLISWADYMQGQYPELQWLYHCPNGGKRSKAEAMRFRAAGVKPGVPDLCLPVPRGKFHGLYIEMKYGKNRQTQDQARWIAHLISAGYYVEVCYGFEAARDALLKYLNLR